MNRAEKITELRKRLKEGKPSIGSWMQLPNSSVAEIIGDSGYEWTAIDLEHGSIDLHQLPDMFRALEISNCLPFVRLAEGTVKDCKQALDAGAAGLIVPMVHSAEQLLEIKSACSWPPTGTRGVGFSRANHFGKYFDQYREEAQAPFLVAQIEHIQAVENFEEIIKVPGLDAILIGPYDLSASMNLTAQFDHPEFQEKMNLIRDLCKKHEFPAGVHIVSPNEEELRQRLADGFRFIAYSIDAVFLRMAAKAPKFEN